MSLSYNSNTFNVTPYYDDFNEESNYLRTLFKPGRAVQARELTQIQTTLQNQIEKFGNHVFENGAVVAGGEISEAQINYLRIDSGTPITSTQLSDLVGQKISYGSVVGQVYHVLAGSTLSADPHQIVFYQHTTQGQFAANTELGTTGSSHAGITFKIEESGGVDPIGNSATIFTIGEGVSYIDGFFLKTTNQTVVPYNNSGDDTYREFASPSASIGWGVSRNIKTSEDDNTLKDPSSGFYNYNAPGGDRYNIDLTLKHIPFTATIGDSAGLTFDGSNYVELVRIVGGSTTKSTMYTDYSDIEESFARRTRDESGNYTVTTPSIKVMDYTDVFSGSGATKFAVGIGPNKSYVGGYEINTQSTVNLSVDKPLDTTYSRDTRFNTDFGSYIIIDTSESGFGKGIIGSELGWKGIEKQLSYNLVDGSDTTIGSTNLRTIKKDSDGNYRAYIFNTNLNAGATFGDTVKIKYDDDHYFGLKTSVDKGPYNAGSKSLLFRTPNNQALTEKGTQDNANDLHSIWVVQKQSSLNIPAGSSGGTLSIENHNIVPLNNDEDWLVTLGLTAGGTCDLLSDSDYNISVDNTSSDTKTLYLDFSAMGQTAPASGVSASIVYGVEYTNKQAAVDSGIKSYRAITSTNVTTTVQNDSILQLDGNTYAKFTLPNSDIIDVTSIKGALNSDDIPVANCVIDNGQRQTAYNRGLVYVTYGDLDGRNEWNGDTASITITYNHYSHSNVGPVTVDSFMDIGGFLYDDIPDFVDPDSGLRYDHRRCIDFRPVENSDGTYTEFGIPFSHPTAVSTIDGEFYLPRIDKVCLCADRNYRVVKGSSSVFPEAPQTTSDDMDLYSIIMKSPIRNLEKDVKVRYIDNKRYTMRQIGEIEENLERVESERYLETLYNDGISRASGITFVNSMESGAMVDDFSGHAYSDVTLRDHNCAMDFDYRGIRPSYTINSIRFNGTMSQGLTLSSDNIYTYDYVPTSVYVNLNDRGKLRGTDSIQINPYGSTDYLGSIRLYPYSDVWYDDTINPKVLVNTFGENNAWQSTTLSWDSDGDGEVDGRKYGFGSEYREWVNHWVGVENRTSDSGNDPDSRSYVSPIKTARKKLPSRILETVNDRTLDSSVVPYMRSVGITFHGEGLLPGSTVYAMIDGTTVGNASGYSVGSTGSVSSTLTIPTSTFLSGERLFRLSDSSTNNLSQTNTSADATFYSKGLIQNKNGDSVGVRPPSVRRKSAISENIIDEYYEQNLDGNYSAVVNGLQPLSQVIKVDASTFPQGTFLSSIDLWFKTKDDTLPVMVHICPMTNGSPHPSVVLPFSKVVVSPTTVSTGPDIDDYTRFDFSTPVYLKPGEYAICITTNSPNNVLFKCVDGNVLLDEDGAVTTDDFNLVDSINGSGIDLGGLFLPLNNGSREELTNEIVTIRVNRCKFDASRTSLTVQFLPSLSATDEYRGHIVNIVSNDQLFTSNDININYDLETNAGNFNGIVPNRDIGLNGFVRITSSDLSNLKLTATFSTTVSQNEAISPVLDADRVSAILAHRRSNFDGLGSGSLTKETLPDSSLASTLSRYVSKIVNIESNQAANDIVVYLKVDKKEGNAMVFVKKTLSDNIDDENWIQLYQDGTQSDNSGGLIDGGSSQTVAFRPLGAEESAYDGIGDFSKYSIKIVPQISQDQSEDGVPLIQDLRAVPLKLK